MVQFKMVSKTECTRSTVISARTRGIDDIKLHKSTITYPCIVIEFYVIDASAAEGNAIAPVGAFNRRSLAISDSKEQIVLPHHKLVLIMEQVLLHECNHSFVWDVIYQKKKFKYYIFIQRTNAYENATYNSACLSRR